ncbi:MAG TPA: phenylacetate--CoA ligase, partial [Thermoplasmatales archaeon]|nr:phenylacetate--CoA ligase [Thermoplasmatales archaeon]
MNDMFNKKIEIMDKEKIRELQLKRLKETVHRVYDSVPFYRKKLDEKGVSPGDVKTL